MVSMIYTEDKFKQREKLALSGSTLLTHDSHAFFIALFFAAFFKLIL